MTSNPIARFSTHAAALVAALMLVAAPGEANATFATLKRSVGNMLQAPLDLALSPIVAAKAVYDNLRDVDDSPGVRFVYPIPGWIFITGVNMGASVLRGIGGVIEFIPGIGLALTDADLTPTFDLVDRTQALVEYETPVIDIKFGNLYTGSGY